MRFRYPRLVLLSAAHCPGSAGLLPSFPVDPPVPPRFTVFFLCNRFPAILTCVLWIDSFCLDPPQSFPDSLFVPTVGQFHTCCKSNSPQVCIKSPITGPRSCPADAASLTTLCNAAPPRPPPPLPSLGSLYAFHSLYYPKTISLVYRKPSSTTLVSSNPCRVP